MGEYILPTNILEAGIDESNRGGLIGEVVSACVVMKYTEDEIEINKYKEIKDSKKLTTKKRTMLVEYIKNNSVTYGIGTASVEEIDSINILNATMKAMRRAANEAYKKHYFEKILVDGPYFNGYIPAGEDSEMIPHECIIKGDSKYINIAAASILAKDYHGKNIIKLVKDNAELEKYGLLKNQGYGTALHLNAIKEYGISKWHRKSFKCCNVLK
jgi:ribonuclease HII